MVRESLHYLNLELDGDQDGLSLTFQESSVRTTRWRLVQDLLKRAKEQRRLRQVLDSSDQGRSYHAISLHPASSHWIPTGSYISFAEYKFAPRAWLNLLPVGTVARRLKRTSNATCRKCQYPVESLGHVLNACTPNTGLMRQRHNAVLQRVVKALSKEGKDVFVEQDISPDKLRPDIVVKDRVSCSMVVDDLTMIDKPKDPAIFVSLSQVRHCYKEVENKFWTGPRNKKKRSPSRAPMTPLPDEELPPASPDAPPEQE